MRRQAGIFRPNITGGSHRYQKVDAGTAGNETAALYSTLTENSGLDLYSSTDVKNPWVDLWFDASRSNPIYGSNSKVQNPAINVLVAVRY